MTSPERRFFLFDDEDERPARWPRRLGVGVATAAVVVGVVLLVAHFTGSSPPPPHRKVAAHLPPGTRPLPGAKRFDMTTIGVTGDVDPTTVVTRKAQVLKAFDHIPGHTSRSGRRVLTSVAELAYIKDGVLRRGTFWVVSVWWHPYFGAAYTWCVDNGLINADTGAGQGHVVYCPAPGVLHPRAA